MMPRAALVGAALLLGGCSALQVDVDVYKGALLNQKEVQQRQYAYLAVSAKPLIVRIRNRVDERLQACPVCPERQALQDAHDNLESLLAIYTGDESGLKVQLRGGAKGIDDLTDELAKAYDLPANTDDERKSRERSVASAFGRLNEALIFFAERILFVVNNESLFSDLSPSAGGSLKSNRSVLQSLANTLLVHANDLQRRHERDATQKRQARVENAAVERAFRLPPALAFDQIVAALTRPAAPRVGAPGQEATPDLAADDKARLRALGTEREAARKAVDGYALAMASLAAAVQTLVGDAHKLMPGLAPPPSATEHRAAAQDRDAVTALYPEAPVAEGEQGEAGALAPLRAWLERESDAGIVPERQQRLRATSRHVEAEKSRLLAGLGEPQSKADLLQAIRLRLRRDATLAAGQHIDLAARVATLDRQIKALEQQIARAGETARHVRDAQALAQTRADDAARMRAVVLPLRDEVLALADAARVTDAAGVAALLKSRLATLARKAQASGPPVADLELALDRVGRLPFAQRSSCSGLLLREALAPADGQGQPAPDTDACSAMDQLEVVDGLIASLRAQRVQALSAGDAEAAASLMAAINAAYDQRTAMIYLRPASDYLRSAHSASELQEASEPQYRSMLNDWWKYLLPNWLTDRGSEEARRRVELDKLYWQNINRVSLGGGGATNFVLAKDDIGNWYVKAYSADPAEILNSATQLALFNAGQRLNTNLLQRHDLQKRLDASTDSDERDRLSSRLDRLDSQDGRPLLALQARYARQYALATHDDARRLFQAMSEIDAQVRRSVATSVTGKPEGCQLELLLQGLNGIESTQLEPVRSQLGTLLDDPGATGPESLVQSHEAVVQAGLIALQRYAGRVFQALDESQAPNCSSTWLRPLAQRARELPRSRMLELAHRRRDTVQRYEDALVNLTEVAAQR